MSVYTDLHKVNDLHKSPNPKHTFIVPSCKHTQYTIIYPNNYVYIYT